ncbi:hypothetical protein SK128_005981, partial [Halocaridina rubra]
QNMGDWRSGYNSDGNSSDGGGGRWGGDYGWGGKDKDSSPSSDGRGGRYFRKSSSSSSSNKDAYATYTKDDGFSLKDEETGRGWGGFDDDDDNKSDKYDLKSNNSSDGKSFDVFKHSLEWKDGEQEFKDEEANFSVDSELEKEDVWRRPRRKSSSSDEGRKSRRSWRSTSSSEREFKNKRNQEWRKSRSEQYYPDVVSHSNEKVSWCCCILM